MRNIVDTINNALYESKSGFDVSRMQNGKINMKQNCETFAAMLVTLATQHSRYYFTLTDLGGLFACKNIDDVEEYLKTSKISNATYKWVEQEGTDGEHFHQVCVDDKPVDKKEFLKYFANAVLNTDLKKLIKKYEMKYLK